MTKRRRRHRNDERAAASAGTTADPQRASEDQVYASSLSLHELFEQQTREMLDRTDLNEEQKQSILVAMSCPCCGGGAMSYTAKLKR